MNRPLAAPLRGAVCFAIFAVAFAGVCAAIHRAQPLPEIPNVWHKLTHLAARHDDYDTLFIGSSRIHYQVIPRIFDELSAARGEAVKSFNAGVAGMRPPEDSYFLEQILAHRPARLRWVFIELAGIRPAIGEERRGTLRVQYWHDWPRLATLWRHATQRRGEKKSWSPKRLWRYLRELREPLGTFYPHLELFMREQINLGKAEALTSQLLTGPRPPRGALDRALGPDLAGWVPTGRGEEMIPASRDAFDRELAERREKPAKADFGDAISQETLEAMLAKIEKAGATPVLIVPPTTNKKKFVPRPERAAKTLLLDFSDVAGFPKLYERRHRLDTDHTNTAGSEIFTRLLVQRWLEERPRR